MEQSAAVFLKRQAAFNRDVLKKNLEVISSEESLVFPLGEANCANFILGHLIFIRNAMIQMLGGSPVWNNNEHLFYNRGAVPKEHLIEFLDFQTLQNFLEASNDELEKGLSTLEAMEEEQIENFAGLMLHEIYHAGQLGYLRGLLGKEGAIK